MIAPFRRKFEKQRETVYISYKKKIAALAPSAESSQETPPIGKIHLFSKMAISFEPMKCNDAI